MPVTAYVLVYRDKMLITNTNNFIQYYQISSYKRLYIHNNTYVCTHIEKTRLSHTSTNLSDNAVSSL